MNQPVLMHSNIGTGHYTLRHNREVVKWLGKAPFHGVVRNPEVGTFLLTKGTFAQSRKLGRIVLEPYTGNWPRLRLCWEVVKEIVND